MSFFDGSAGPSKHREKTMFMLFKGFRTRALGLLAAACLASPMLANHASAVIVTPITLTDGNSSTVINPLSQAGQSSWLVDGVDQITGNNASRPGTQWFWYSVGNNAPASIDTLTNTFLSSTANSMNATYSGAGFSINLKATLVGGSAGSGNSAISETVTIDNTGNSALKFHLYNYADLNLDGMNNDSLTMSGTPVNTADQTDAAGVTGEVSVTNPDEWQSGKWGVITGLLNGASPVTLNDTTPTITNGNVDFAFQWDPTVSVEGSYQVSINKEIIGVSANIPTVVPLPAAANSALALLAGLAIVGFARRMRKSVA
jgi:hypothetical protein